MNNLFKGYNELPFGDNQHILHGHIEYDNTQEYENEAHKLLRKDCEEYYRVSLRQVTVRPLYPKNAPIESILSKEGLEKYNFVTKRAENTDNFKDEISEYALSSENSGSWFANSSSTFYDPDDLKGILNCLNNIVVYGWSKKHQQSISTSPVVFITPKPVEGSDKFRWCITKSGSLYKLGKEFDIWEMHIMIEEKKKQKNKKTKK
jgi:hypothetical protein